MTLLAACLVVSSCLFAFGIIGALLARASALALMISVQLILLGAGLNFAAFAAGHDDPAGIVLAVLAFVVAFAQVLLFGALLFAVLRNNDSISLRVINILRD